jgi:hypothetical protein
MNYKGLWQATGFMSEHPDVILAIVGQEGDVLTGAIMFSGQPVLAAQLIGTVTEGKAYITFQQQPIHGNISTQPAAGGNALNGMIQFLKDGVEPLQSTIHFTRKT